MQTSPSASSLELSESGLGVDWNDVSTYKELLDDFPVGLWAWKYHEQSDEVRLVYANAVSDAFLG